MPGRDEDSLTVGEFGDVGLWRSEPSAGEFGASEFACGKFACSEFGGGELGGGEFAISGLGNVVRAYAAAVLSVTSQLSTARPGQMWRGRWRGVVSRGGRE